MQEAVRVLVDFVAPQGGAGVRHAFAAPRAVLQAWSPHEVRGVIDQAHAAATAGAWCVGFVRYEAAPAFDAAYAVHEAPAAGPAQPLAWFAVFDQALPWDESAAGCPYAATDWQAELAPAAFGAGMARIARAIEDGENYQINYTMRLAGTFAGDAEAFFHALRRSQPDTYAAFIDTGHGQVLSVSPELFFEWRDGQLLSRPMKGTAARGATPEADAAQAEHLRTSEKERAEDLMIVDLIRNDISRVAQPHTVKVPRLFHTQAWPTFWGMTSDVTAASRPGARLSDVFAALFPCGSVVGVPKVRAMQLIRALEPSPRGVYCGAIGVLQSGGAATFNVAIRTVAIDAQGRALGAVGSGVTSDARPDGEWREWRDKWAFLRRASEPFDVLETVLLQDGRLPWKTAHLDRMAATAAWFGRPWDAAVRTRAEALLQEQADLQPQGTWRVRLLLDAAGQLSAQAVAQPALAQPVRVVLADRPLLDATHEFVRHNTTRRVHYDALAPHAPGVFDTLLWNEAGELTEFTRGNVVLKIDGRWLTPPLACGLLAGVGRARLLVEGLPPEAGADAGQPVHEAVVLRDDLTRAEAVAFVNSCRGWMPVVFAAV
ncbi:MAG: Aminodeoxychorismate synthase component 1 [Paracidovorax wautersii]|uniref:Aminodeoxychorismate synthase component 1 n=1 Tax=Paracidovorax wautersii TaxID=1177982 RepID=A0A7V8FLC6_9BURK|nr:MAG: Aminodeoxychorismate synthase component 1 [Paracidovorax wautersii]